MAARRILSLMAAKYPHKPLSRELSRSFHPSPNSFPRNYEQYTRGFQSLSEAVTPPVQNQTENGSSSSNSDHSTSECVSSSRNDQAAVKHQVNSKVKISESHDLVIMFTCSYCDTRNRKTACRESYHEGLVVARCNGCSKCHLIADRQGCSNDCFCDVLFFRAPWKRMKKVSVDTRNFTLEDLEYHAGRKDLGICFLTQDLGI